MKIASFCSQRGIHLTLGSTILLCEVLCDWSELVALPYLELCLDRSADIFALTTPLPLTSLYQEMWKVGSNLCDHLGKSPIEDAGRGGGPHWVGAWCILTIQCVLKVVCAVVLKVSVNMNKPKPCDCALTIRLLIKYVGVFGQSKSWVWGICGVFLESDKD